MKNIFLAMNMALMTLCGICSAYAQQTPSNNKATPLIKTTVQQGEIEGVIHENYALYKAIPYAEAPVGQLRWKAPVAKKPWQGVLKAENWGNRPPQPTDPNQTGNDIPMSEDCLYLSIQTPAKTADERLPVFVMIHGGAFLTGSYSGTQENFVREGIVYVSIEYRLGALGFMAHPELSKESSNGTSGNYGIMDQIMALQWIHDNIAAFGGDPANVTIAGESAGAISVSMLCASPKCKGLFQRAISESGSSFWPVAESRGGNTAMCSAKAAETVGADFLKKLGVKNIKQARKLPFDKIVAATQMESFWPVVDGDVIVDDQYKLYEKGEYNDVDVLIGTNSDEGWLFTRELPVEAYKGYVSSTYGDWAERMLQVYPATTPHEAHCAMADIFRDGSFAWGTYAWAKLQARSSKKNVYMYYFDQSSENMFMRSPRGGNHVAEMAFIYDWHMGPMTPAEEQMARIMPQYWINFTKTGNPNSDLMPYWPTFQENQPTVMNFHNGCFLTTVPNKPQIDFFEDFFRSKRESTK